MTQSHIYLDYNASAPLRPAAQAALVAAADHVGNSSSVHGPGRAARALVEDARADLASAFGCAPRQIIFTSGGTEANGLALHGLGAAHWLVSAVEHPSVLAHVPAAQLIPVDAHGRVELAALEGLLAAAPAATLVSVMAANNEIGVIQPIDEIARLVRAKGAWLHCDATQAAGRLWLRLGDLDADLITISAHKLGGPVGIGALVHRTARTLSAQICGGGQELGARAGTQNPALAASFAAAVRSIDVVAEARAALALRERLEEQMERAGAEIIARAVDRLPNTSAIRMAGVRAETQVMALDMAGFAVSAGAACSSGKVSVSPVLLAMGMDQGAASEVIRVSLGWRTTADEIDAFVMAWRALHDRLASPRQAAE